MTDVHDKKTRSYNMSQIKAKNTKPEMRIRKFLHAQGFRYSLYNKNLPGKPDIVLPKYKTVIPSPWFVSSRTIFIDAMKNEP